MYHRGIPQEVHASTAGLKIRLVRPRGVAEPEWFKSVSLQRETSKVISTVLKTHRIPDKLVAEHRKKFGERAFLTRGMGPTEALKAAYEVERAFDSELPRMLTDMGMKNLHPLVKAEYLLGGKEAVLPARGAAELFGGHFSGKIQAKGLHQAYNVDRFTAHQLERIERLGGRAAPGFMYQEEFAKRVASGVPGAIYNRLPLRVGIVDFENELYSRLLTREGGAILTEVGRAKLAGQLPTERIVIAKPSRHVKEVIGSRFGVNLALGDIQVPDIATRMPFSSVDVEQTLRYLAEERAGITSTIKLTESQQQLMGLVQRSPKYAGVWRSAAKQGSLVSAIQLKEGKLVLDFMAPGMDVPGSLEMVSGYRRLTANVVEKTHQLKKLTRQIRGVDLLVARSEFQEMFAAEVFLDQFFSTLQERGLMKEASHIYSDLVPVGHGKKTWHIPLVSDRKTAVTQARQLLATFRKSGEQKKVRAAAAIAHGTDITSKIGNLAQLGIKGISVFNIGSSIRSDFMGDISVPGVTKLTPSKLRTLAVGSRVLGYKTPYDDPLFSSFHKMMRDKGFNINPITLDIELESFHPLKKFARSMLTQDFNPTAAEVVQVTERGLLYNNRLLKTIPDVERFAHREGGVPLKQLRGTILEKGGMLPDMLYLDVGNARAMDLLGDARTGASVKSRYIPVPIKYLRANQAAGGRVVVGPNDPAYQLIKALNRVEASGTIGTEFTATIRKMLSRVTRFGPEKPGILSETTSLFLHQGVGVRLVAPRARVMSADRFGDVRNVFDVGVSSEELEDVLSRQFGRDPEGLKRVRKSLKERKFTYVMLGADPAQRPEHMVVARLRVQEGKRMGYKYGQLNLDAHPFLLQMFERDVDRDRLNMVMMESLESHAERAKFEDRLLRQKTRSSIQLAMFKQELAENKLTHGGLIGLIKYPGQRLVDTASHYISSFLGQKRGAARGYSLWRSVEPFMPALAAEGVAGAQAAGLRIGGAVTPSMIEQVAAPFAGNLERAGAAEALMQYVFQGGVAKGQSKSALESLGVGLSETVQKYREGKFAYREIVDAGTEHFYEFLRGQGKTRIFMAMPQVMDVLPDNYRSMSAEMMLADLKKGANEGGSRILRATANASGNSKPTNDRQEAGKRNSSANGRNESPFGS
ncbi:MAG: hypothetical protein ACXABY_16205 [Candidatus Thorarchaeota archaeon]